ncbi:hypothetical protein NDU88_007453 [Pleurodeles waltl]|uniref:Uncharacterized protein n=1 Tax=Pleurodeles waltl TaxID=8319 RepID=A0AAV7RRV0_PLEWA|nr:hypothetical protein NDU88_007453 [Pleurodeles waltl]
MMSYVINIFLLGFALIDHLNKRTQRLVRSPYGKETRTRTSEEASDPTIAAAAPCTQVLSDPSTAGGDGEELQTHPRMP